MSRANVGVVSLIGISNLADYFLHRSTIHDRTVMHA